MQYPGGKGGAGVYQTIINLMPQHDVYVEAFVGGGNVLERKRPAASSIVIDRDEDVCAHWRSVMSEATVVHGDAVQWLREREWTGRELVYCDPPYVHSTRVVRSLYQYEMSDEEHVALLSVLQALPVPCMLSGYQNAIYQHMLRGWRRIEFRAMTRRGVRTESLWLNFDPPAVPFDLRYVGRDFRERERIKRKRDRWYARLSRMDAAERAVIMEALRDLSPSSDMAMQACVSSSDLAVLDHGQI